MNNHLMDTIVAVVIWDVLLVDCKLVVPVAASLVLLK
jgi:hypothetical protein